MAEALGSGAEVGGLTWREHSFFSLAAMPVGFDDPDEVDAFADLDEFLNDEDSRAQRSALC